MRRSQCLRCSSVEPTTMGSVPRKMARKAVPHPGGEGSHILGHAIHVVGRAAESAQILGNEEQVQANLRPQELLNEPKREFILFIEVKADLGGQLLLSERPDGIEKHLE